MTLHLIKLCVGVDTVQELKDWQTERLKRLKRAGKTPSTATAPCRRRGGATRCSTAGRSIG